MPLLQPRFGPGSYLEGNRFREFIIVSLPEPSATEMILNVLYRGPISHRGISTRGDYLDLFVATSRYQSLPITTMRFPYQSAVTAGSHSHRCSSQAKRYWPAVR